jgi:hypothetical protein
MRKERAGRKLLSRVLTVLTSEHVTGWVQAA